MSLYGVRLFIENGTFISSPVQRNVSWDGGIQEADCRAIIGTPNMTHSHLEVPSEICMCGFYANFDTKSLLKCANKSRSSAVLYFKSPYCIGLVEAFGKVVVCEDGFRSQYMQVVGILPIIGQTVEHTQREAWNLFGFPVVTEGLEFTIVPDQGYGEYCAKLARVECLSIDYANYLLTTSKIENQ